MSKKRHVWTQANWYMQPRHMETPRGVSKCVPSETMTIQEIVNRFVRGVGSTAQLKDAVWPDDVDHDDVDLEEVNRMDLVERSELVRDTRERVAELKLELKAEGEAREKAKVAKLQAEKQKSVRPREDLEKGGSDDD